MRRGLFLWLVDIAQPIEPRIRYMDTRFRWIFGKNNISHLPQYLMDCNPTDGTKWVVLCRHTAACQCIEQRRFAIIHI